jgi:hypothetical protein
MGVDDMRRRSRRPDGWKSTRMPLQHAEKINAARVWNGESGGRQELWQIST